MAKGIKYYLAQPYTRQLTPEPCGHWTATIKEIPGCISYGNSRIEALDNIEQALEAVLLTMLDCGIKPPAAEPINGF